MATGMWMDGMVSRALHSFQALPRFVHAGKLMAAGKLVIDVQKRNAW